LITTIDLGGVSSNMDNLEIDILEYVRMYLFSHLLYGGKSICVEIVDAPNPVNPFIVVDFEHHIRIVRSKWSDKIDIFLTNNEFVMWADGDKFAMPAHDFDAQKLVDILISNFDFQQLTK